MELRQLRHFTTLARTGSITSAALQAGIVQSGLSHSIQALERDLGSELYVRGTRPVRLTAAGKALVQPAQRVVEASVAAERAVRDVQQVLAGPLRLGVATAAHHAFPFAAHLGRFLAEHPGVVANVCALVPHALLDMLEGDELDCVIAPVSHPASGLRLTPVARQGLSLVVGPDHPLAGRPAVRLHDLRTERFIDAPAGRAERLLIDARFAEAGLTRRVVAETDSWETLLGLVEAGAGIGFVPTGLLAAAAPSAGRQLRPVPVQGVSLEHELFLVLPRVAETAPSATAFATTIAASAGQVVYNCVPDGDEVPGGHRGGWSPARPEPGFPLMKRGFVMLRPARGLRPAGPQPGAGARKARPNRIRGRGIAGSDGHTRRGLQPLMSKDLC